MNPIIEFKRIIDTCLPRLGEDEWAIAKGRESIVATLEPYEAFDSIPFAIDLALEQTDSYAFLSCCWFILDLANRSNTTELPDELPAKLKLLMRKANDLGDIHILEVKKIALFYRLP